MGSEAAQHQMDTVAFVALGANLGDPLAQLRRAAQRLAEVAPVIARSSIYLTSPVGGPPGQNDYLNAVVALDGSGFLGRETELLTVLLAIESDLGRVRRERWGPRIIDLDLLALGSRVVLEPELRLPHPELERRAFVLAPLVEVAPDWRHPLSGRRADDALQAIPDGVKRSTLGWLE